MKTKIFLFIGLLYLLIACKKDGGVFFIPNFPNDWESNRNSFFQFTPGELDVNESTLTGTEFSNEDGTFSDFTGSFKNYDVNFTFLNGKDEGIKYSGKFIKDSSPLQMRVTGDKNGEVLILTRMGQ
jgi:hypothetical protein